MRQFRSLILLFLFLAPVAALSALRADDLPSMSKWYFHADFKQMRSSEAGQHLYAWLQDEVFDDIREDAGVDLDKEADFLTAFATEDDGMIIVIEGNISQETEDKVVAMGAAIQGAVLKGDIQDVLLLDVTPLSLGIETLGGVMTRLTERNTTIPARQSQVFSTAEDNQPAVTVHVLQGEREMAADNKTLGRFELTGIPPAPRGTPQIEVSFDIDANGIVSVAAKDMASGKEQSIRITASSGLDQTEIDRLIKEAEMNADTDRRKKGLVDARNEADGLVYTTSKSLADLGDKIDAGSRQQAEAAVASLKAAMAGEDTAEIRRLTDELTTTSLPAGDCGPGPGEPPSGTPGH